MATRQSAAKGRSGRKRVSPRTRSRSGVKSTSAPSQDAGKVSMPSSLEDAIEDERSRLMRAHSILGCVTLAMEGDEGANLTRPYYPDLIELARDLVNESINALDSDRLDRLGGDRGPR